jgi:hypothetical protein
MTDWMQGYVSFILAECNCIFNETVELNALMLSMPKPYILTNTAP